MHRRVGKGHLKTHSSRGGSIIVPPVVVGGGYFDQPFIDEALGGTITEGFRDNFDTGIVDINAGGKWPITEGDPIEPFAQATFKRSGGFGVEVRCGQLDPGKDWGTGGDATTQRSPKIGLTRGNFDDLDAYVKDDTVFMQAAYYIPSIFPDLSAGTAMGNYLALTQFKGTGVNFAPILNIVLGRDTAQGDPLGSFRVSTHVRPGGVGVRTFATGPNALCPVDEWFILTQKVVPHQTSGLWHGWLNQTKIFALNNFDTVSDLDLSDNIVTAAGANGYIFYPYNNLPINSTVSNFSLYGDDCQIWSLR